MAASMDPIRLQKLFVQKLSEKFSLNLKDIKKAFGSIDNDGNGLLNLDELSKALTLYLNGVPQDNIEQLVELYDANGDGMISYEEFLYIMRNPKYLEQAKKDMQDDEKRYSEERKENMRELGRERGRLSRYERPSRNVSNHKDDKSAYVGTDSDLGCDANLHYNLPPAPPVQEKARGDRGNRRDRGQQRQQGERDFAPPTVPDSNIQESNMQNSRNNRPDSRASVFSFRDEDNASERETVIDLTNPKQLESRSQAYISSLRALLRQLAAGLRQGGKVGTIQDRLTVSSSKLLDNVGREILIKAFQPYTGASDGRTRTIDAAYAGYVDIAEFSKVLRSFKFPGGGDERQSLRVEVIHFLFCLCEPTDCSTTYDENGQSEPNSATASVADPTVFIDMVLPPHVSPKAFIRSSAGAGGAAARARSSTGDATVTIQTGRDSTAVDSYGKANVGTGPMKAVLVKDQKAEAMPQRFISRRSRTAFATPKDFDASRHGDAEKSSRPPGHDLSQQHVHGLSTHLHSGNVLLSLPTGGVNPNGVRSDPGFIDPAVAVYASASVGVIHDLSTNRQQLFTTHKHEITCIALSHCGTYVATGSSGSKESSVHVWRSASAREHHLTQTHHSNNPESICEVGKGFFERAVCAVSFLCDPHYLCGIGCDDGHTIGIWDIRSPKTYLVRSTCQNGIPPQIRGIKWAPYQEYTQYISKSQRGQCDVACSVGEHHIRLWSFKRPEATDAGGVSHEATLLSRAAVLGTDMMKQVSAAKVFTCVDFAPCADRTSDVLAGGSNGLVYLYRQGRCVAFQNCIKGGITCLQTAGDIVVAGGVAGVVKCMNVRTLAVTMSFRTSFANPTLGVGEVSVQASGTAVSTVARMRGSAGGGASSTPVPVDADFDCGSADVVGLTVCSTGNTGNTTGTSAGGGSKGAQYYALVAGASGRAVKIDFSKAVAARHSSSSQARDMARAKGSSSAPASPSNGVSSLFFYHTGEVWGLTTGKVHSKSTNVPSVSLLATTGDDRRLYVWNPSRRNLVAKAELPAAARAVDFDRSCQFLTVGSQAGSVYVYGMVRKPSNQSSRGAINMSSAASVTSSRISGKSASSSTKGASGSKASSDKCAPHYALQEVAFRKDFREGVSCIKFSPSGDRIAAGSNDDSICLYACHLVHGADSPAGKNGSPVCTLRPLQRLRGHSSYITHLDWSRDSDLLRSTCGAYELLFWNTGTGKQHTGMPTSDLKWASDSCPLGFNMMGIWPAYSDGTDINSVDVGYMQNVRESNQEEKIVVTGDDSALVSIMNYPCVVKHAPRKSYNGHGAHVTNVKWFSAHEDSHSSRCLASIGGRDATLIIWEATATPFSPRAKKYNEAL